MGLGLWHALALANHIYLNNTPAGQLLALLLSKSMYLCVGAEQDAAAVRVTVIARRVPVVVPAGTAIVGTRTGVAPSRGEGGGVSRDLFGPHRCTRHTYIRDAGGVNGVPEVWSRNVECWDTQALE